MADQGKKFRPCWYETGTPNFLIDLLQRGYCIHLLGITFSAEERNIIEFVHEIISGYVDAQLLTLIRAVTIARR